jgi:NTE family protein
VSSAPAPADASRPVPPGPVRGLVLSGGGARGAYEAGVLDYVLRELPSSLLERGRFRVLCGTSVGAVHACYLAATAERPDHDISNLVRMWRSLELEDMLRLRGRDLARMPIDAIGIAAGISLPPAILVNPEALQRLAVRDTPWGRIRENLASGLIDALTVTATHIASGRTVNFVQHHSGEIPPWTRARRVVARATTIRPVHALASAAIPFLFPPVKVDDGYYCEGGLRQNTPLSPALRLGADRVLVVGLRHVAENAPAPTFGEKQEEKLPGPFKIFGKILDALLLDHLDYDLARLEGFNALLRDGRLAFGEGFDRELSAIATRMRGASYREVAATAIRPSRDLGAMATEFVQQHKKRYKVLARYVLRKIADADSLADSDFLSYLLFDGRFAEALMELGRADADASREKLIAFFED